MFTEGTIIYFTPFYFKNGKPAKNKYFVVLKNTGTNCLIASLPSSQDHVPSYAQKSHGCIECEEAKFNCFVIAPTFKVTQCGKSFPLTTYLYGHQLDEYTIQFLEELYPNPIADYEIWGQMETSLFQELITCFKKSKSVKNKYKKIL